MSSFPYSYICFIYVHGDHLDKSLDVVVGLTGVTSVRNFQTV